MRSIRIGAALILTLAVGCEHTSKKNDPGNAGGNQPGVQPPADPVGKDPNAKTVDPHSQPLQQPPQPPPAEQPPPGDVPPPPPSDKNVRPPVAADLVEYLKNIKGTGKLVATFDTSMGTINCELFGDKAPMTVANFVGLATGQKAWKNPKTGNTESGKPYFDGLTFHRVIPEFMIQGGDPLGIGSGGPGYKFGDEFLPNDAMKPGTLAMANAGASTNGSQFFITEVAPSHLNGRHTIFGQCKELDLVKAIARVPQNDSNKPNTPVTMNKVAIKKMQSW